MRPGFLTFAGLLIGGAALASEPPQAATPAKRQVLDLHYGDVLFHFYQADYFGGITRLMAARDLGRAEEHAEDGDLLLGGMLLSYGQHEDAAAIFQRTLQTSSSPEVRDRVFFYLARASFERGALEQAQAALARIEAPLPDGALEAERLTLGPLILLAQQRFDEAAHLLAAREFPSGWASYARFNLGVALIRAGRFDEGRGHLEQVGVQDDISAEEQLALRDRANVALGEALLRDAQDPDAAAVALRRVRLHGPYANRALLGLGWAEVDRGRDREALIPWSELNSSEDGDGSDPAVQESLLAVPTALARLEAYAPAIVGYQKAIDAYEVEKQRLDTIIAGIRGGNMFEALLGDDDPAVSRWTWRLDKLPRSPQNMYLYSLMASNPFQESLKNYRDMVVLRDNLAEWSRSVAAFSNLIEVRRRAYATTVPETRRKLATLDFDALRARRAALAAQVTETERRREAAGLVPTPQEGRAARAHLKLLGDEIAAFRRHQSWVDQAKPPNELDPFAERIEREAARLAPLAIATDELLKRHEARLEEVAIGELERHRQRLADYSVEARFSMARVYDRAALLLSTPTAAAAAQEVKP